MNYVHLFKKFGVVVGTVGINAGMVTVGYNEHEKHQKIASQLSPEEKALRTAEWNRSSAKRFLYATNPYAGVGETHAPSSPDVTAPRLGK